MKKIISIVICLVLILSLASCGNKTFLDLTYTFNHAILSLPNGSIVEGKVESWIDFEDGDQIQVKINGVTYLLHSSNVVLMAD